MVTQLGGICCFGLVAAVRLPCRCWLKRFVAINDMCFVPSAVHVLNILFSCNF
jgi:hypothetical protein